nr:hypothetical protein [Tanacetum cinerariifolium]
TLTPLDVDSDPNIHEFLSAKELKDATDCHWVVTHVTPPSWKRHLRDISIEQLYDIHDRAYMRLVNGLHNEYGRLLIEERKWDNYEQTMSFLRAKFKGLESERKKLNASEIQMLQEIDRLVRAAIVHYRCMAFEEIAKLKEPFILEKMLGYHMSSKDEYDRARGDIANASFPFLYEFTSNPYASVEQLL